jgi:hypothetical protein
VASIQCQDVDLDDVLIGLLAILASFAMKNVDLPPSTRQLKMVDFQPLQVRMCKKELMAPTVT